MRYIAKNIVAAGLAAREVQLAYAIGKAQPVGVFVQTFGTGVVADEVIQQAVLEVFDLRPAAIIRDLDLLRPIYAQTSAYGHFGRELPDFTWENTDRAEEAEGCGGEFRPWWFHWVPSETTTSPPLQRGGSGCFAGSPVKPRWASGPIAPALSPTGESMRV